MTLLVPDYSCAMLRVYLHARIVFRRQARGETHRIARKAVSGWVRRDAGITHRQFEAAIAGRLNDDAARGRIWGALGVSVPNDRRRAQA